MMMRGMSQSASPDPTAANKELVRRAQQEMWNPANWELVPELCAPDIAVHLASEPEPFVGHDALIELFEIFRGAVPDRRLTAEDVVAEADRVAVRSIVRGTNTGSLFGAPPTGRTVAMPEAAIYRCADGKLQECWFLPDLLSIVEQLGFLDQKPPLPLRLLAALQSATEKVAPWRKAKLPSPQPVEFTIEGNKALVERGLREIWNGADWDVSRELYGEDLVVHQWGETEPRDLQGFEAMFTMLHTAFPDFRITLEDLLAEGDRVAARWLLEGTHEGVYFDFQPTGKRIAARAVEIFRFADGRLRELWTMPDRMGVGQQLGVAGPGPPPRLVLALLSKLERLRPQRT